MSTSSHLISRVIGFIIILGVVAGSFYIFFKKQREDVHITYSTSDAKNMKGEITIALDSWIGYFPFKSPVFGKLMRDEGYRVKIIDDKANYETRMSMLKKGRVDFAVCTIDSYLLNGEDARFPGTIIAVIDESKGGDAIVAWKNSISNIDQLKTASDIKIAFTPASPSEHLLKSIAAHFDIPMLNDREGDWRVEVEGAEEAYEKLINNEVDMAALWEPHVTEAVSMKGIVKLIGSEDIDKLIVDILLVNRKYAENNPELVTLVLKNFFKTQNIYRSMPNQLTGDILKTVNVSKKQVRYMLKGVRWIQFGQNVRWFGMNYKALHRQPEIIESINSTVNILIDSNDFDSNPLPDKDPYTIVNSDFIKRLTRSSSLGSIGDTGVPADSLTKKFSKLSDRDWLRLKIIGSLKLRPISFRSGTARLDDNGNRQIKIVVDSIRHYPNFRILVKGHTGLRGDPAANKKLSRERAGAVKNKLVKSYGVDPNRIKVIGMASAEPLERKDNESERAFNTRLKRVELMFMSSR
jgi:outer membrane protein OmpA-like peptidoglycan-associated protein